MYAPPRVPRGTKMVKVFVGPEEEEFVIHKNLLCASSKFFERALNSGFVEDKLQELRLPEEQAALFAFFSDWLYNIGDVSSSMIQARKQQYFDEYFLTVYRMADRLMIRGLQVLAFHRIKETFTHLEKILPSREFLRSLFGEEGAPLAIQMYVVRHVVYWLATAPHAEKYAELLAVHDRFGVEIAQAMVRGGWHGKSASKAHPNTVSTFEESHGLNLAALEEESRAADQPLQSEGQKMLRKLI